jgi:hypothetical protein
VSEACILSALWVYIWVLGMSFIGLLGRLLGVIRVVRIFRVIRLTWAVIRVIRPVIRGY